jgi:LSD1 subclass zinc finger protein
MAGSEDTGEEPVPRAPSLQPRQVVAGFSRHRFGPGAAAAAQDPSSSNSANATHRQDQNELLITTTELDDNVPVPKSRPLGRRVSSRRLMMSQSLSSANSMFTSSSQAQAQTRTALSRSSSGTSNSTNRRGSVILAQLRAATAAGSIQGAESNDEDDDRLIDVAVNTVIAEPDNMEASMLGVSRDVSGSSVNSKASRASSVRSKEPKSTLESRFAGVSLKPAPVSTAAKAVPNAMEAHVPSSDDCASSFDMQAALLAASNNKSHPVETSEYVLPGGGDIERPGLGERQPSWMRDALEQMSAGDVEAFLKESHATMDDAAMAIHSASSASLNQNHQLVDGFENTEVLEQYRMIAHHEARQRVKENLGYDPVERAREEQLNSKKGSSSDGGDGKKESILKEVTLPPMCPPAIIPITKVGICLPKESLPISRFLVPTATPRQPELCKGQIVPGTSGSSSNHGSLVGSSREIQIVARCLGCRSFLQVPMHATLVHCPQCSTISPATSTR